MCYNLEKNTRWFFFPNGPLLYLFVLLLSGHEGPDKVHGLLESVGWVAARVEHRGAEADVGQDLGVRVDLVQGVQHGLQPLRQN